MSVSAAPYRYNSVAIALHWGIAVAIFMMLASGIAMEYAPLDQSLKFNMYQWHKSGGVLLLLAVTFRLLWRLSTRKPQLPETFKLWEKRAAHVGHLSLYAFMLIMPLTGWLIVSTSVYGLPTIVFGWFEWPHIPGVAGNKMLHEGAEIAHLVVAILLGLTIITHIGAVVKHAVKDGHNLLSRIWWTKQKETSL